MRCISSRRLVAINGHSVVQSGGVERALLSERVVLLEVSDNAAYLVTLALGLGRANGDWNAARVVHKLAAHECRAVIEAVEQVKQETHNSSCAAVATPTVQVDNFVGRAQSLGELDSEVRDGVILAHVAVFDAEVNEAKLALGGFGLVVVHPGRDLHGLLEIWSEGDTRAPLLLGGSRIIFALKTDKSGDADTEDAAEHAIVFVVLGDARECAHHESPRKHPVGLICGPTIRGPLLGDKVERFERREAHERVRRCTGGARRGCEQGHRVAS